MTTRYEWLSERRPLFLEARLPGDNGRLAALSGWALLGAFSGLLLAWLLYRWLGRPPWLAAVPPLLRELLFLAETAGAFTVAFLWTGLSFRRWRSARRRPATAHTVAELYALSPAAFEQYVADLFGRKGYRVSLRGGSGDHGVDLELVRKDGRHAIVQCKRYRHTLGEELVRDLYGALLHEGAAHAFMVTTADISVAARDWAAGKAITLIDGETLIAIAGALQRPVAAGRRRRSPGLRP